MKSKRVINIIALVIGISALTFLVYKVGFWELLDNLISFGAAFPLILLIEALSNVFSCIGWHRAFEPDDRPSYGRLLLISFASLSLAGALPTGQAGEVAKGNMIRGYARPAEILSSLLIYNYLHILTTLFVVIIGPIVALVVQQFEVGTVLVTLGVCIASFLATGVLGLLLYSGILHKFLGRIGRIRLIPWTPSDKILDGVREVDQRLRGIVSQRPGDLARGIGGLFIGRVFQVAEIYTILHFMGVSSDVTVSLMVFSVTAVVNYVLMVLPAREGFLEGSTLVVFEMLGMSGVHGLSLEITRRLRKIVFQVLGIFLMVGAVKSSGSRDGEK
jgi:hypothetical protein